MRLAVLFFARARELTAKSTDYFEVDESCSVVQLVKEVVSRFPELEEILSSIVLSVNHEYVSVSSLLALRQGDEIAFIPPISGG